MSVSAPNPWSAQGLDPDITDAEAALDFDAEVVICRRAFSTAQGALAAWTEIDSTYKRVSLNWHHTALSLYEGSFAVVQTGGRLEQLVGEIIRVTVAPRQVYAYVVAESSLLDVELSLARRAFLAIDYLAQKPAGVQAKVEVMV